MKTYKATVKASGRYVDVKIQARSSIDARAILEAQYGKGNTVHGPTEIR